MLNKESNDFPEVFDERRFASRPHLFRARLNAASELGNFLIGRSAQTGGVFVETRHGKEGMGVGINESRQHHLAPRIQTRSPAGHWVSNYAGLWSHDLDRPVPDQKRTVADQAEVRQLVSHPRACRPAKGQELAAIDDEEIMSRWHRVTTFDKSTGVIGPAASAVVP